MFDPTPAEQTFGGIYFPPALILALLGLGAAWVAAKILNRTRMARFFWNPPLAFLAIWALMTAVIGLLILAP